MIANQRDMFKLCALFFSLSILVIASNAFSASSDDPLINSLAREITPLVHTLQSETLVFNYTSHDGDLSGVNDPQAPEVLEHIRHVISLAGTGSPEITTFGPGFYVALDPFASRMYGGNDFALFTLRLHEGFRYVQLDDSERYSQPFVKAMEDRGCSMVSRYLKRNSISLSFKNPRCTRIVKTALKKLGVSGLAYPFKATTPIGCRGEEQLALVLTDPDIFSSEDVLMLTAKAEPAETDAGILQRRIQAITPSQGPRIWNSKSTSADAKDWAHSFLWNCR